MPIQHAKSPCCRGVIYRFGNRRRQCANCHRTWSIRDKKRGPQPRRTSARLVVRYLTKQLPSLARLAQQIKCTRQAASVRLHHSLDSYLTDTYPSYLTELESLITRAKPLVMVVDAMWHQLGGSQWTTYLLLLKPVDGQRALILSPIVLPGHEGMSGWQQAMASLPKAIFQLITGVVSDGGKPLCRVISQYPWVHQRCHFHLLSQIQNYVTTGHRSAQPLFAKYLMKQVQTVLRANHPQTMQRALELLAVVQQQTISRGVRRILKGLQHDLSQFRAYQAHPELHLPTTSNAAESVVQLIRDLLYRARGFRSPTTYTNWITARLRLKGWVSCRGSFQQK